jgi:hypothetical protein
MIDPLYIITLLGLLITGSCVLLAIVTSSSDKDRTQLLVDEAMSDYRLQLEELRKLIRRLEK